MKKKKNAGFTLVELVIAVVILAIAVSPLVANFIQSSRMNLKARKALNAMNLAQDIMEGMSQYSVSENTYYLAQESVSPNTLVNQAILPKGTTFTGCSLISEDDKKTVYKITGIKTTTGNYNNYDIEVIFDSAKTAVVEAFNDKDTAAIQTVDKSKDIVFTLPADETTKDLGQLKDKSTEPGVPVTDYYGKVNREIKLDVKKTPQEDGEGNTIPGKFTYSVSIICMYTADVDGNIGFGASNPNRTASVERTPNMASTSRMPRALYFYYEGLPGASESKPEKITVTNTTGEDLTVYLIRTIDTTKANIQKPEVASYNLNYRCDVDVNSVRYGTTTAVDNVDIVYNLRYDLTKGKINDNGTIIDNGKNVRIYKEDSVELLPGITQGAVIDGTEYDYVVNGVGYTTTDVQNYKKARSHVTYQGFTVDEAFYSKHFYDGYRKSDKKLLYEVEIKIYEAGKSNIAASYTGGLSN